jgi:hypothetical protein
MRTRLVLTLLVFSSAAVAFAQTPITIAPSPARQGQPITVSGMPCVGAKPTVMFDAVELPATAASETNAFQVSTATLAPGTHKVTLRCGAATSKEVTVEIVSATPPGNTPTAPSAPTVTCVENLTPGNSWTTDGWRDLKKGKDAPAETKQEPEKRCDVDVRWIVRMESDLAFHVNGYAAWREGGANKGDNKKATLHVFIEGIEVQNLTPHYQGQDPDTKEDILWTPLKFETNKGADESRDVWAQILRMARSKKALRISIGEAGGPYWSSTATVEVNSYPTGLSIFTAGVILGLITVLILAGWKTPLLRDSNGAHTPPFSLAKHQMAVWFVVVVAAYLFVTTTTGASAATSPTALILIGISGATGLTAIMIDKSKREAAADQQRDLESERASLIEELGAGDGTGLEGQLTKAAPGSPEAAQLAATIQSKRERLKVVVGLLSKAPPAPGESQNWFKDLLSDENGISFHRLQIGIWTIVMVGTFIAAVWRTLAMPDFDATTLGLMGISSGMYLGFKFPEKPA